MSVPAVIIENLNHRYDKTPSINDLSLTLESGRFVGLLGENGCGKTTLLKILAGLMLDYTGSISICGSPRGIDTKNMLLFFQTRIFLTKSGERRRPAHILKIFLLTSIIRNSPNCFNSSV